jgi:hypothetical protein
MKTITYILIFFLSLASIKALSQVGINTDVPSATLEVVGDVIVDNKLYLESPGEFTVIQNSKLLVKTTGDNIVQYDIDVSKYGPLNYVQYIFTDLSTDGLQDYDTKIPIDDYLVTIKGYYFFESTTGNTSIVLDSTISNENIEGYQFYAYPNTSTNTWFLRGIVNNAKFQSDDGSNYYDASVDLFLNLIIYRNGFITKVKNDVEVDMGNSETVTIPLPAGF